MPEFQEKSIVRSTEQFGSGFHRLTLHAPRIAAVALPGQFVMATCSDTLDPLLRRPFSIHRCPTPELIQLLIRVVGRGTGLLAACSPGQEVGLIGPLGRGFSLKAKSPSCLVGGGIGIAPLLFLADRLKTENPAAIEDCHVLLGARSGPELAPLAADFSALGCQVETATDDGSLGHHGLVTDLLPPHLPGIHKVYVCGPQPMMAAVASLCRSAEVGCEASLEAHMACGLGACLGCTVHGVRRQYLHVCKDGPVMIAEEVAWDR